MQYYKKICIILLSAFIAISGLLNAQSSGFITKRGWENNGFKGGVFIGYGAHITTLGTSSLKEGQDTVQQLFWKDLTGITQSGSILTKTASSGWGNAGGASDNKIDTLKNAWVGCKINSLTTVFAFGLSNRNPDAGRDSIKYAVEVDSGLVKIYNYGTLIGNYGTVAVNDSIRIERIGDILFYAKNQIVFFNQQINAKQPLIIDAAIYTSGASLDLKTTGRTPINSYYRSAHNGNWNLLSTWETSADSSTWTAATVTPDNNSKTINIKSGDTVTITASVAIDQTIVNGTLIYGNNTGSTVTINDGTGTDLTINGTFEDIGPNNIAWTGSSTWLLYGSNNPMVPSGTLLRTRNTSSDNWRDHYQNGISNMSSTAMWIIRKTGTDNPLLSSTSGMYYPNLTIENTSGSSWTTSGSSSFTGSTDYPRIKGNFNIGGNGSNPVVFVNLQTDSIPVLVGGTLHVKSGSTLQNNGTGFNIGGNLEILGAYTGTKNMFFSGNNIQTISDTSFSRVKILSVNKPGGQLKYTIPLTVDSVLVLNNGSVDIGDTKTFVINSGALIHRSKGFISTSGTGLVRRTTTSLDPYLFPIGHKTTNDSADVFIINLSPGKTGAQKFDAFVHSSNTGFVVSYDTTMYGTGTETVKIDVTTRSYTPIHLEYDIDTYAHINAVRVFDQNDNTLKTLPASFYTIIGGHQISIAQLYPICLEYGGTSGDNLNWTYEISYDANGIPVSEKKQYLDYIGRPTQLQVRNMADNSVLVSQTLYDNYGRAAVQTLPAPTGTVIAYQTSFITDNLGNPYDYNNFDLGSKLNSPDAVSNTLPGTLGAFYSNNSSEAYVAATSYPYARTEFTSDPSSSAKRSAKAGDEYRLGNGHETRAYTMVSGDELKYIFGAAMSYKSLIDTTDRMSNSAMEIGNIQAVKSISKDADGKEMVSYSAGLAVASCYTGLSDACSMTTVSNTMVYAGTSCVDIHLPNADKATLKFPLPQYVHSGTQTISGSNITYKITDLNTNAVLIYGTDYTIATSMSGIPTVTFLGSYSSGSSVFRISFVYSGTILAALAGYGVAPPDASVMYSLDYSRWSVNYYDLAGRLRKSVSPKGISCSSAGTITMATTYDYSAMGQPIAVKSPDEGLKEMTYDDEGKARFTQNAVQYNARTFSYSNYDAQARAVESGEYASSNNGSSSVFFQNYYSAYSAPYSGNTASSSIINNTGSSGMYATDCSDKNQIYYYPLPADHSEDISSLYSYVGYYKACYLMGKVCKTKNAQSETWYGYNQAGQTVFTVQQLLDADYTGYKSALNDQIKTVDYTYNTANGTLSDQTYQKYNSSTELLKHSFEYDGALRLQKVKTAIQGGSNTLQAVYSYYETGALKRKELGDKLQGIDYIYTVNGQLKSINHPSLDETKDPGLDGSSGSSNAAFGKDVFGLTLDYHPGDYSRSGSNITSNEVNSFYTGLISAERFKTRSVTNSVNNGADYIDYGGANQHQIIYETTDEIMNSFVYDDQYRLSTAAWGIFNNSTGAFTVNANNCYKEWGASSAGGIGYDVNGNITSLKRNAYNGTIGLTMDDFAYTNTSNTNKLASIIDAATSTYSTDLDAATSKAFTYNTIGQMTVDEAEGISDVTYFRSGLTKKVTFGSGNTAEYWYNDRGLKIKTKYYNAGTSKAKYTWYVSDAGGNPLAVYEYDEAAGTPAFTLTNEPFYGSGRIGALDKTTGIISYEVSDNLGNVRAVIKSTGTQGSYELTSRTDYYAFGGAMPGRTYNLNTYRYNYQGQEKALGTNWETFELRMHNSDLGRWMSPDPKGQFFSPYVSMGNNPVSGVDPNGAYCFAGHSAAYAGGVPEYHAKSDQQKRAEIDAWYQGELNRIHLLTHNGYIGSAVELNTALNDVNRQYGSLKTALATRGYSKDGFNTGLAANISHGDFARIGGSSGLANGYGGTNADGTARNEAADDVDRDRANDAWQQVLDQRAAQQNQAQPQNTAPVNPIEDNLSAGLPGAPTSLFWTISNKSTHTIYFKPETTMTINGQTYDNGGAYPIAPGDVWNYRVDGISIPDGRPGEVFKVKSFMDLTFGLEVYDNTVTIGGVFGPIPNDINEISGGGWKDKGWINTLNANGDSSWNNLFQTVAP